MDDTQIELTPKAEQTRQRIFDTAVTLFVEKGYEATTMRDIASAGGVRWGWLIPISSRKKIL